MTHAENDEDKRAIACLERAVEQVIAYLPIYAQMPPWVVLCV